MRNLHESYLARNWRPWAFVVYALICMFDFVVMPTIIEMDNRRINDVSVVDLSLKFTSNPAAQTLTLQQFGMRNSWQPLTMAGAGLFHLAFGALLTGTAWLRGQERLQAMRRDVKDNMDSVASDAVKPSS